MTPTLDDRQLRAFSTVARMGGFTPAARELNLSQSAISHAIKALEEDVGCRLLDRSGKKTLLTQAGEQLLLHADHILETMTAAREELTQLGRWGQGRLRLAVSTTACQYLLPNVLREFKQSFPACAIHIEPGDTPQSVESFRARRVDLALCMEPRPEPRFAFRRLFSDELHFIVNPLHPWAQSGRVKRDEIVRQNYIVYTKTSNMFALIEQYFRREDIELPASIELGNIEAIKELVKIGVGVSILAPWVAKKEIAENSLVALRPGRRKLERHWGILHWREQRLSLAEETFIGLCRAAAADL